MDDRENIIGINDQFLDEVFDDTLDFLRSQIEKHERLPAKKIACSAFGALSYLASTMTDESHLYFLDFVVQTNERRFAERDEAQNPMRHFRDDAA